jgi:dienelactone hydrolase
LKKAFLSAIALGFYAGLSSAAPIQVQNLEKVDLSLKNHRVIHVQIRTPAQENTNKLPAFLLFGGFESAGEVLKLVGPDVPCILASFDYPFAGSRQFQFPQSLREAPLLKQGMNDTLEGILILFRYLKNHPKVDPNQIGIIGASFGSPFALWAASQEPGFRYLVLPHGFSDPNLVIQHRLKQILERKKVSFANPLAVSMTWGIVHYLNPPDFNLAAENLSPSQNILVLEATEDEFIPERAQSTLWQSLQKSPAKLQKIQMKGGHLRPGDLNTIQQMMNQILEWLTDLRK